MKIALSITLVSSLTLLACGSTSDSDSPGSSPEEEASRDGVFDPPPPPAGYERIVAPVMPNLNPGDDIMYCQYVRGPSDRDVDILDVRGFQSTAGHHVVAYATTAPAPLGKSGPCEGDDNLAGGFLGGTGGEAGGSGSELPEGVAFRLPKGSSIMLNTHFLNTTDRVIDGESVLDVHFAEVDPNRKIASMFVNGKFDFELPASSPTMAATECVVGRDMEMVLFSNHMHDFGVHATTELIRMGSDSPELVHLDPEWSYEMQFNPVYQKWDIDSPLLVKKGDTIRTECNWVNDSADMLTFPREMCVGVGFFLSDGSTSPICYNGVYLERTPGTPAEG